MKTELYPAFSLLIIDDTASISDSVVPSLQDAGFTNSIHLTNPRSINSILTEKDIGLVVLDISTPNLYGDEILHNITQNHKNSDVIVISDCREIACAVKYIKAGASDYLTKPVDTPALVSSVRGLVEAEELIRRKNTKTDGGALPDKLRPFAFRFINTRNKVMENAMQYAESIAGTPYTVLITGETGTGKELFSRAIHELSLRKGAYITVNIAGLDDTFFSDTLFGHTAGAFTGAVSNLSGLLEKAEGGTILLDEIGDLCQTSQIKLLRLLETNEYYPLGSDRVKKSSAKILVATNKDLKAEFRDGKFRKDLYYRLCAHRITLPALRDRIEDIPLLAAQLLNQYETETGFRKEIDTESLEILAQYDFPGNIRELRSILFDAAGKTESTILPRDIIASIEGNIDPSLRAMKDDKIHFPDQLPTIRELTRLLVKEALVRTKGHQAHASVLLGISPQALGKRLQKTHPDQP